MWLHHSGTKDKRKLFAGEYEQILARLGSVDPENVEQIDKVIYFSSPQLTYLVA